MSESMWRTARDSWRQAWRAISGMPRLAASTFLLIAICQISLHPSDIGADDPQNIEVMLRETFCRYVQIAVLASALIAVHRFVILGEVTDRAVWRLPTNYWRFAGCLLLLRLPFDLTVLLEVEFVDPGFYLLIIIFSVTMAIVGAFCIARVLLLFPGLALGRRIIDFRAAWASSRGHAWRFIITPLIPFLFVVLPLAILFSVVLACEGLALAFLPLTALVQPMTMKVIGAVQLAMAIILWGYSAAAVASRFFQIYGESLAHGARVRET